MDTNSVDTYSALYYPFIHFKDEKWLKLAALYWDKLGRIIPHGYRTEDGPDVHALGDFIQVLHPDWVRPQFGTTFVEFVEQFGEKLRQKYSLDMLDTWEEVPVDERPPKAGGRTGTDPRLGYVFYEKMSERVQKVLMDSKLATVDDVDPRWIGMHPKLATVYMTALADQLAGERGLYSITDNPVHHLALSGLTVERLAQALLPEVDLVDQGASTREVETVAASVALQTVLPRDIAQVPIEKILKFREKYPSERGKFQKLVAEFVTPRDWLSRIEDPKVLNERLQEEYNNRIKPELTQLQEALKDVAIDTVHGCFNVKAVLPSTFQTAASLGHIAINPIVAASIGFLWAVVPVLRDKQKEARGILQSSRVTYLMRVEEQLKPQTLHNQVWLGARKFLFNV